MLAVYSCELSCVPDSPLLLLWNNMFTVIFPVFKQTHVNYTKRKTGHTCLSCQSHSCVVQTTHATISHLLHSVILKLAHLCTVCLRLRVSLPSTYPFKRRPSRHLSRCSEITIEIDSFLCSCFCVCVFICFFLSLSHLLQGTKSKPVVLFSVTCLY